MAEHAAVGKRGHRFSIPFQFGGSPGPSPKGRRRTPNLILDKHGGREVAIMHDD